MREAIHPTSSHHGKESIDCKEERNGDDQADWGAFTSIESRVVMIDGLHAEAEAATAKVKVCGEMMIMVLFCQRRSSCGFGKYFTGVKIPCETVRSNVAGDVFPKQ